MPFPLALIGAILPTLVKAVMPSLGGIFKDVSEGKMTIAQAKEQTTQILGQAAADVEKVVAEAQRDVIIAESQSESWLTANWRPLTMMTFLWVILWYVWLQPAFEVWFGMQGFQPQYVNVNSLLNLITIGLTGYVGGRSIEKAVANFKNGKPTLESVVTSPLTSDTIRPTPKPRRQKERHGPRGQ